MSLCIWNYLKLLYLLFEIIVSTIFIVFFNWIILWCVLLVNFIHVYFDQNWCVFFIHITLFNKSVKCRKEKVSFFSSHKSYLFNKVIIKIMISMFKFGGRLPSVDRGLVGS